MHDNILAHNEHAGKPRWRIEHIIGLVRVSDIWVCRCHVGGGAAGRSRHLSGSLPHQRRLFSLLFFFSKQRFNVHTVASTKLPANTRFPLSHDGRFVISPFPSTILPGGRGGQPSRSFRPRRLCESTPPRKSFAALDVEA